MAHINVGLTKFKNSLASIFAGFTTECNAFSHRRDKTELN